jgi:DNA recombination protein RmuC
MEGWSGPAAVALLLVVVLLQVVLLRRRPRVDLSAFEPLLEASEKSTERVERAVREEIARNREESAAAGREAREEVGGVLRSLGTTLHAQVAALTDSNRRAMEGFRSSIEEKLRWLQEDSAKQLERMRQTVDEKLQGTLEKRLGESFRQVSERLEAVSKGLGEMQTLASGVGDLKKVLTNVRTRGTWGEVQLSAMLAQVLSPEQYAANVSTKDPSERVEFAIRLPGRGGDRDEPVWLPIDAKFPLEDYQRLLEAQELADAEAAELAAKQLEMRVRACAKEICRKYVNPPKTTDFALLFLPIEGLFAAVLGRPGLAEVIQRECRIVLAGPTTLWSILNSLQMGFRTLAIEQRSSEVWSLLAAVKTEWGQYGEILRKVQKKLTEASDSLDKAQTRTRAIGRKLREVQELPPAQAETVLRLEELGFDAEDAEEARV